MIASTPKGYNHSRKGGVAMSSLSKKIIAIAVGLLVIAFTVFTIIRNSRKINFSPDTIGAHAGNLYNDGLFCESDGKVYFSNSYD